jgi:hypothetical protein
VQVGDDYTSLPAGFHGFALIVHYLDDDVFRRDVNAFVRIALRGDIEALVRAVLGERFGSEYISQQRPLFIEELFTSDHHGVHLRGGNSRVADELRDDADSAGEANQGAWATAGNALYNRRQRRIAKTGAILDYLA